MFYVEKSNFTDLTTLVLDVVDEMEANGFEVVYPLSDGVFIKPDVQKIAAGNTVPFLKTTQDAQELVVLESKKKTGATTFGDMDNPELKYSMPDSSWSVKLFPVGATKAQKISIEITGKTWKAAINFDGEKEVVPRNTGGQVAAAKISKGGWTYTFRISSSISSKTSTATLFVPRVAYKTDTFTATPVSNWEEELEITGTTYNTYAPTAAEQTVTLNFNSVIGTPLTANLIVNVNVNDVNPASGQEEETWAKSASNTKDLNIGDVIRFDITDPTNGFWDAAGRGKVILETNSTASNALHATQPWRICFEIFQSITKPTLSAGSFTNLTRPELLAVYAGTHMNLDDTALKSEDVIKCTTRFDTPQGSPGSVVRKNEPVGNMGSLWTNNGAYGDQNSLPDHRYPNEGFFNRYLTVKDATNGGAYPMGYNMVITSRGLFLSINETSLSQRDPKLSWFVIQRGVDKDTGVTRGTTAGSTSRCPVFCINSVEARATSDLDTGGADAPPTSVNPYDTAEYYKFIVREKEMLAPSKRYRADIDDEDSSAVINPLRQVSFNENGDYVITFLNNLNTPHFKYTDELDMVGTISADVVGYNQTLNFTVYGEAQPRTYKVLSANSVFGTGMRVVILTDNPNE